MSIRISAFRGRRGADFYIKIAMASNLAYAWYQTQSSDETSQ